MRRIRRGRWVIVAAIALVVPASAQATFRGQNGALVIAANDSTRQVIEAVGPSGDRPRDLFSQSCDPTTGQCPSTLRDPSVSADGGTVAFATSTFVDKETYTARISLLNIASAHITSLPAPRNQAEEDDPSWFPGGSRIALDYSYFSIPLGIRSYNTGDSRLGMITSCPCYQPTVSPAGRRILFVRGQLDQAAIWIMRSDGSHARRVEAHATDPSWAPDGRRFAFVSLAKHGSTVLSEDLGGRHRRVLARNAVHPVFSPDGKLVAFFRQPKGYDPIVKVMTVRASGGGLRRVLLDHSVGQEPGLIGMDWQALPS